LRNSMVRATVDPRRSPRWVACAILRERNGRLVAAEPSNGL